MEQTIAKTNAFLSSCGMLPDDLDLGTVARTMLGQMRIGFYGGTSSIPIRPSFLTPSGALPTDEPVAVAEITPREIRTCLVTFTQGMPHLTIGDSFPVPGAEYPAPLEDLIFAVAELLTPLLKGCRHIALCLPFPMEKTSRRDGTIIRFPEGMRIEQGEGKSLQSLMTGELNARGFEDMQLVLVSTAGAALLGGQVAGPSASRHLSLYWDHGIDGCFCAPESAVLKLKTGEKRLIMLDTGAGSFTGFPFGTVDLILDRDSAHPGEDLLLKSSSTQTLGEQYRLTMVKAVEAGLVTYMCGRELLSLRKLDLSSVTRFLANPAGDSVIASYCGHDDGDRAVALTVARRVLERAARLACANLAASLIFTGAGQKVSPALVSLCGNAFAFPALDAAFRDAAQLFITEQMGRHVTFWNQRNSIFLGGAAAALQNS